jgi:glycine/D-amino acid oxidase-like deaminating enzyme
MNLLVVGAGFWGSTAAIIARAHGHAVTVLDDGNPRGASRNAAGMVHPEWYKHASGASYRIPTRWTPAHISESIGWLETTWGATSRGELFSSYHNPEAWRHKPGLRTLHNPLAILESAEPERARITHVEPAHQGWAAVAEDGRTWEARTLLLATGAWTDAILETSGLPPVGVVPLRGHALIITGDLVSDLPMTRYVAPYRHYTIRPWLKRGQWRAGDTVERTISTERAAATLGTLRDYCKTMIPEHQEQDVLDGYRPIRPDHGMDVETIAPGLLVATGGHRIGLGVAAVAAHDVLRRMETP